MNKKWLLLLVPILSFFSMFLIAGGNREIDTDNESIEQKEKTVYELEEIKDNENVTISNSEMEESNIMNILVLGVDEGGFDNSRSDVMMVASVDVENKDVKLTSFMRDTLTYIPTSNTYQKLNHSYMEGGPEETKLAFNENFGLDIENYVVFDFDSVTTIVDFFGGYPTYVNAGEAKDMSISPGNHLLDGEETLMYMRVRYNSGGDEGRNQRQRDVMFYILEEAKDLNTIQLLNFSSRIMPSIRTSYNLMDIRELLDLYEIISEDMEMKEYSFPSDYRGKILSDRLWYAIPQTFESNVETLHNNIYGNNDRINQNISEINNEIIRRSN